MYIYIFIYADAGCWWEAVQAACTASRAAGLIPGITVSLQSLSTSINYAIDINITTTTTTINPELLLPRLLRTNY